MEKVKIFLSYCRKDIEEADKICRHFQNGYDIELHRDVIDVKKWSSIKEYMESLGSMDYAILLISEAYLKSANCMYEVLEAMRDRNYRDKIFPAIINNEIYDPITRIDYVKYWEDEFIKLKEKLSALSVQNLGKLPEDLKRRQDISSNIAEFLDTVSDMNNPDLDDICVAIEEKLKVKKLLGDKIRNNCVLLSEPVKNKTAGIIVVGVGHSGNHFINRMIDENLSKTEYVCIDKDKQALQTCRASKLIQIGERLTMGRGTDSNPQIGENAAYESYMEIMEALEGADIVFVICGMGGGTGTGAAPVTAKLSKEMGILTIGIVTKPFSGESNRHIQNSIVGIRKMKDYVDSLIVVSNDNLLKTMNRHIMIPRLIWMSDIIVLQMIAAIEDLINMPAIINLDMDDVRCVMKNKGIVYVGTGKGTGDDKAVTAAEMAVENPFLEITVNGATKIIINVSGDVTLTDASDAVDYVRRITGDDVEMIFGVMYDDREIDSCMVTVIATGMDKNMKKI